MSIGLGLLEKMISEDRSMSYLSENGIPEEAFKADEKIVLNFIAEHYRRHGRMPKIDTVAQETEVDLSGYPDEPIGYWTEGVIDRHTEEILLDGYKALMSKVANGDLAEAVDDVQAIAMRLSNRSSIDRVLTLGDVAPTILTTHDKRQRSFSMRGVPFGLPYLDEISDGAHSGDTVAIVGRPGVGKSYIMGSMSNYSYENHGEVPLVVTMEMSGEQWVRRALALSSGVTASLIRLGKLSVYGRNILSAKVASVSGGSGKPYYILQGSLNSTVEDLGMRVQELRPTVVYVDGAYLMQTKNKLKSKWEKVTEIAEFQKMLARDFNIPVIASWQFNRKGPGSLGNISYSDAIGQLASIVCAVMDEKDRGRGSWKVRVYKILKLLKGREGERGTLKLLFDMGRMTIEQHSIVSGYALEGDEEDDAADY